MTPSLFIGESHFKQGGVSPFQKMLAKCVTHDPTANSQERSTEPQGTEQARASSPASPSRLVQRSGGRRGLPHSRRLFPVWETRGPPGRIPGRGGTSSPASDAGRQRGSLAFEPCVSERGVGADGRETLTPQVRGEEDGQALRSSKPRVRKCSVSRSQSGDEKPRGRRLQKRCWPRDPPRPRSDARGRRTPCLTPPRPGQQPLLGVADFSSRSRKSGSRRRAPRPSAPSPPWGWGLTTLSAGAVSALGARLGWPLTDTLWPGFTSHLRTGTCSGGAHTLSPSSRIGIRMGSAESRWQQAAVLT